MSTKNFKEFSDSSGTWYLSDSGIADFEFDFIFQKLKMMAKHF